MTAHEATWRDRHLFVTSPSTFKKLTVQYPTSNENSFELKFENNDVIVSGISKLDSNAVDGYLSNYPLLEAVRYLPEQAQKLDSLNQLAPLCIISLEDLYAERNNILKIYPSKEIIYGVLEKQQELVELSPRMLKATLVGRQAFVKKEP